MTIAEYLADRLGLTVWAEALQLVARYVTHLIKSLLQPQPRWVQPTLPL